MSERFRITDPLPEGTVLLEASAGTGKTWTIAALVTRYVAEGVVGSLEDLLVVTFSRAASQELRARVRQQLTEAEQALAGAVPEHPDELITLLLDGDAKVRAERHRRIRTALTRIDVATIATVHQFCQEVLRSLGVAGTSDTSATLVEDVDDLLTEVVDDLYLGRFRTEEHPPFTRREALNIARKAVEDIHATLRPAHAERGSTPDLRFRFATEVRRVLDQRKRRARVMHFNDLLTQLNEALAAPDSPARVRMRRRWSIVLVDEFQDTDPVQWQVLSRAFADDEHTMVLIGDPKQAIYGFRGGDVDAYLQAASVVDRSLTLPQNFRSDPALVEALTTLLEGAELGDPQITVQPVTPALQESRLQGHPVPHPLRLRQVMSGAHLQDQRAIATVREHIATDLARDIARLLATPGVTFEGRPLQARDIAVLARKSTDLTTAQRALRAVGVPSVHTGSSSVFAGEAAHEWLTLLEALAAPHRSLLTRAAALTSLLGVPPEELVGDPDRVDDHLAHRCRELSAVLTRHGVAAVLEALTADGLPARVLARVGGERSLTDLRHVAELLHEAGRAQHLGLTGLLEWLRVRIAESGHPGSGDRTRRLDSDASAVQLLTIHGSKGLQFPIVYLPSLTERYAAKQPDGPARGHEDRERFLDVGGPGGPTWTDSVERFKLEEAREELRLMYVALTRAQSQVVTWWSPSNASAAPAGLSRILFGRAPGQGPVPDTVPVPSDRDATARLATWAELGALHLERADHGDPVRVRPPAGGMEPSVAPFDRVIDHTWRRASYTALSSPSTTPTTIDVSAEPEIEPGTDEPEGTQPVADPVPALPGLGQDLPGADLPSPMADLPVGAAFGSLVHAVLEHADPDAEDLRAELRATVTEQLVRWPVPGTPAAELVDPLTEALVAVLDTPLGPLAPGATLRGIPLSDRLCELDFELPLGGGDLSRGDTTSAARLGDLAPLLRRHLPEGDPVRAWADDLDRSPELAEQYLRGYLTGSVDVVLRTGGRYLVVDYKTNWLGGPQEELTAAHYRPAMLREAMGHSSYPLQALLYAVVAHRFLRWRLVGYDPEEHLGGVLYLYLRGMCGPETPVVDGQPCGVFSWRPPVALVRAVSDLLDGNGPEEER